MHMHASARTHKHPPHTHTDCLTDGRQTEKESIDYTHSLTYLQTYVYLWTDHLSVFFTVGLSPLQSGQYHFPLGFVVSPTQLKWNHSSLQSLLSQPIISP